MRRHIRGDRDYGSGMRDVNIQMHATNSEMNWEWADKKFLQSGQAITTLLKNTITVTKFVPIETHPENSSTQCMQQDHAH